MNGLEEPSIAKRLRGTPERIELENYRLSVKQVEELEEVPEETQAEHNLSSVLDKGTEEDIDSRSASVLGLFRSTLIPSSSWLLQSAGGYPAQGGKYTYLIAKTPTNCVTLDKGHGSSSSSVT